MNTGKVSCAVTKKAIAKFGTTSKIITLSIVMSETATTTASTEGARTLAIISASIRTAPNVSATAMAYIVKVSARGTRKASESTQPRGDGNGKAEKEIWTEEGC